MKKILTLFCICLLGFQAFRLEAQRGPAMGAPGGGSFFDSALSSMENAFEDPELTPEESYYLGRAVAANILAVYKPYNGNPELTRYLNRICMTLAINSPRPVTFNGYHVIILDSPQFNAFATPGGHIFITKGLAEAATSEDMLAALIAHELSHIVLKHGEGIIKEMRFSTEAANVAGRAAALSGNSQASQRLMFFRNSVSATIDTMVKNGYSQTQEFEADRQAAEILAASGYNPGALVDLLRILQRVQATQSGGFNSTHPSPAERVSHVEGTVNLYRVQDTRSFREPRFKNR